MHARAVLCTHTLPHIHKCCSQLQPTCCHTHARTCRFIDAAIPDLSKEQKAKLRSKRAAPNPAAAPADGPGSSKRACSSGTPGRGSQQAQAQGAGRQHNKQPSKKQAAQEFLEELVAEVAEQEGQQQPPATTEQPAAAAGADVDAATFLKDVMASLDP